MFAVPGEITSALSAGTNALLRLGATPLTSPEDVLEALGSTPQRRPAPVLGWTPARVLEALTREPSGVMGSAARRAWTPRPWRRRWPSSGSPGPLPKPMVFTGG